MTPGWARDRSVSLAQLGDLVAEYSVFFPAITVPIVLVLAGIFNDLILSGIPATDPGSSPETFPFQFAEGLPPFEEFASRTEWAASALAFLLLGLACVAIALYTWISTLPTASKRPVRAFVVQLLFIVVGAFALHRFSPTFDSFVLQKPFLEPSVYTLFPKAERIGGAIDVMAAVVIVLVALAVCVSVKAIPRSSVIQKSRVGETGGDITVPARAVRTIRLLLAVAAITMVAGVLQVGSLYRWGTTMLVADSPAAAEPAAAASGEASAATSAPEYLADQKRIPESVSLAAGIVYSALLAGIFLPAFGMLRSRMRALADTHCPGVPEDEREEWLTKQGLVATLPKQALSALAVLAPLLVGGPGSLLGRIFGGD